MQILSKLIGFIAFCYPLDPDSIRTTRLKMREDFGKVRSLTGLSDRTMNSLYGELDALDNEKELVRDFSQLLISEPEEQ